MDGYNGSYGFNEFDYKIINTSNNLYNYTYQSSNILYDLITENKISNSDLLDYIDERYVLIK
jgi:hypothetical protein